jgi:hypothetical protein
LCRKEKWATGSRRIIGIGETIEGPAKSSADVTSEVSMCGVSEAYRAEDRKNRDTAAGGSENQDSNPKIKHSAETIPYSLTP